MPARKRSPAEIERSRRLSAEKLEQSYAKVVDGVQQLVAGEAWQEYLKFASSFHDYSFNNSLLIYLQNPGATYVAGYQTWLGLGRQVRKGEKGLTIFAPVHRRQELNAGPDHRQGESNDQQSQQLQGSAQMVGVKNATIFDVTQTDPLVPGEKLPIIRPALLQGEVEPQLWDYLAGEAAARGFRVERGDCGTANGFTNYQDRIVRVRDDVSDLQAVKTLAHELGHVMLHDPTQDGSGRPDCRGVVEVEAESVAFMTLESQGLDSAEYTFPYIAGWAMTGNSVDATVAVVREAGNRVIKATRELLHNLSEPEQTTDAAVAALMEQSRQTNLALDQLSPNVEVAPPTPAIAAESQVTTEFTAEDLYAVNAGALAYFQDFGRDELAAQYLTGRGIHTVPAEYSVGYAPAGGGMVAYLKDQGFQTEAMIAAGVARVSNNTNQIADVFRDRIMVGLRDAGNLAGFVGRAVKEDATIRYLNTAATPVFNKSALLLGLSEGANKLRAGAIPVMVEGPFDQLALAQFPSNFVPLAACGTAITEKHIAALGALAPHKRVILAGDDDPAGRAATALAFEKFAINGWAARVPAPTGGLDPAEVVKAHGDKAVDWLAPGRCRPAMYMAVEQRLAGIHADRNTVEGRVFSIRRLTEYLDQFPASTERDHATNLAYDLCHLNRPEQAPFLADAASPAAAYMTRARSVQKDRPGVEL